GGGHVLEGGGRDLALARGFGGRRALLRAVRHDQAHALVHDVGQLPHAPLPRIRRGPRPGVPGIGNLQWVHELVTTASGDVKGRAFVEAKAPERLLSVLGRYIQFNSAFGAGLANLAGEIAARQGLFRDAQEPLRIVADRSAEVASDFFFAAIDEFDDRATPWRD